MKRIFKRAFMKNNSSTVFGKSLFVFCLVAISNILFSTCEIGLGSAVDTEAPKISISVPEEDNRIIRDTFALGGEWSDDGEIESLTCVLTGTGDSGRTYNLTASISGTGSGSWSVPVEKGTVADGTYTASITITDKAGHETSVTRVFTADNTSPVVVLQRPSSKKGASTDIDSYGQTFTLEGQAADDSGVGLIEVEIYSDEGMTDLLKTVSLKNVPNTISLDVAKFSEGVQNDYSAIYGSTSRSAGEVTRWCKVIAYDGAVRYPIEGEQSEDDLKGNASEGYYLYEDISADILSNYKITELYAMKSGTYSGETTARSAILTTLDAKEITAGVFTLNPANNPTFTVAGYEEIKKDGTDFGEDMQVTNGGFVTIEVSPGLDSYPLVKSGLKVKVTPCDDNGTKTGTAIYPTQDEPKKSGTSYKIIAYMNREDGLAVGKTYIIEVEGEDEKGNSITTKGNGYGFRLAATGVSPTVSVSSPSSEATVTYGADTTSVTLIGKANFPSESCDGGSVIIRTADGTEYVAGTYINDDEHTYTDTDIDWTWTIDLKKDGSEEGTLADGKYALYVYAIDGESFEDAEYKSAYVVRNITIDTKKPNAPVLSKVNGETYAATKWYTAQNMSVAVTADDEKRDGYASGVTGISYRANASTDWTPLTSVTGGYVNNLKEGENTLYLQATDAVGNTSTEAQYTVNVDTSAPVVKSATIGTGSAEAEWSELIKNGTININKEHGTYIKVVVEENNELANVNVLVGGTSVAGSFEKNADGTYTWTSSAAVSLAENTNVTIAVTAIDKAGGSGDASYTVLVDTAGPVIDITTPEKDLEGEDSWSSSSITLKASVDDEKGTVSAIKYKLTTEEVTDIKSDAGTGTGWVDVSEKSKSGINLPVTINEGSSISGNVTNAIIGEGKWYLYVYAEDVAGNSSGAKRMFWTDRKAPALTVTTEPGTTYNKASLGTNASASISIAGTASDANGIAKVEISTDGQSTWNDVTGTTSWSHSITYGSGAGALSDGEYAITIRATDNAGRTSTKTYNVTIDTTLPTVSGQTVTTTASGNGGWYTTRTLAVSAKATDATSGVSLVEASVDGSTWNPLSNVNGTYTGSVTFTEEGSGKTVQLRATDGAGNISEPVEITGINIDTQNPALAASYYQIAGASSISNAGGTAYVNGSANLTVWGEFSDGQSGVSELKFTLGSLDITSNVTVTYSTDALNKSADEITNTFAAYSTITEKTSIKSWKAVITGTALKDGALTVKGSDVAGNSPEDVSITTLILDTKEPELASLSMTTSSAVTKVYRPDASGYTFWVNNASGNTFTISGTSSDDKMIDNTVLTINGKTYESSSISWSFSSLDLSGITGDSTAATLTITDKAGNKSEQTLTIKFDTTAPAGKHIIDNNGKDVVFRIGDFANDDGTILDVGGKYMAGTWGSTTSIMVRGQFEESGSGNAYIYYKRYASAPTTDDIDSFKKNYSTAKDGYFEALSTPETKTVEYTKADGTKTTMSVKSNFKGTVTGLAEGSNYVLLAAVDNVGNVSVDEMDNVTAVTGVTFSDELKKKWNNSLSCLSLNVDQTAPTVTSTSGGTKYTNENSAVTVTGTATDNSNGSGIKSVTVSVTIGSVKKNGTVTLNEDGTWSATIAAADLSAIEGGKTYNVDAIATDNATNSTTLTVCILQGDIEPPTVTLSDISPSATRTSGGYYIRPQDALTIKGVSDDDYSNTITTWLELVPYTSDDTEATDESAIYTSAESTARSWSFDVPANKLTASGYAGANLYLYAKDAAENVYTSTALTLEFDTAGPVFKETSDISGYEKTTVGGNSLSTEDGVGYGWHNNTSLLFKGIVSDNAGIKSVYYEKVTSGSLQTITSENYADFPSFTTTSKTGGLEVFDTTIDGFIDGEANSVVMYAVDSLGNVSSTPKTFTVKVDTAPPTASEYSDDYKFSDIYLTNGKSAKTLYFYANDALSGINTSVTPTVSLGANKLTLGSGDGKSNATYASEITEGKGYLVTVNLAVADIKDLSGYNVISVGITDNAGNLYTASIGTLNVDSQEPTVTLSEPADADSETTGIQVNKTITLTGTISDTYLPDRPLTALQYSTDKNTWNNWVTDFSADNANVTNAASFTVTNLDTTKLTDGTTYYIRAKAQDKAGNEGVSNTVTVIVNQDTDRPVISFTDLTLPTGTMASTNRATLHSKTLRGTVTDDDGIAKLEISTDGGTNYTELTMTSSSWSTAISDGSYTIVFRVTDTAGTIFTTSDSADSLTTPKLKNDTKTITDRVSLYVMVDNASPVTSDLQYAYYDSASSAYTSYSSSVPSLGGKRTKLKLTFRAGDENGIQGVTAQLKKDNDIKATYNGAKSSDDSTVEGGKTYSTWTVTDVDVSNLDSGTYTLALTVTDGAGNTKDDNITLVVDNTPPKIGFTAPSSSTTSSGSIVAYGSVSEAETLYYAISPSGTQRPDGTTQVTEWTGKDGNATKTGTCTATPAFSTKSLDFGVNWYLYFDGDSSATTGTHEMLLTKYLTEWGITTQTDLDSTTNPFDTIVNLYLWIKGVDSVGNEAYEKHLILLDPQGDRPTITYTYPESNGTSIGGTVRIAGSASDNNVVRRVWMQIVSTSHEYVKGSITSWSGYTFGSGAGDSSGVTSMTVTKDDLDYLASAGYKLYDRTTYKDDASPAAWVAGSSTTTTPENWAILANLSTDGSTWYLKINSNGEFNPSSENTNNVYFRVYAEDDDGKFSINADQWVKIDSDNPIISDLYLVQADSIGGTATASKEYSADMYVKGDWYLTGTVTDSDAIQSLTINGQSFITLSGGTVTLANDATCKAAVSGESSTRTISNNSYTLNSEVQFWYKLGTGSGLGDLSFDIEAEDAVDGTSHSTKQTITIHYDNTPPALLLPSDGNYNISANVQQSDGFYTFGSQVTENAVGTTDQSGVDYVAFYFMRRDTVSSTKSNKVFNPMYATSHASNSVSIPESSGVHALGAETATADNTLVYDSGMYWLRKTVTRNAEALNVLGLSNMSQVNVGSLVKIDGTIYSVSSTSSSTATISGNPPASATVAYVALAMVVNNSTTETGSGSPNLSESDKSSYGYGYYSAPANDDGDKMVESLKKSGSTWTWEANIYSKNITDGPIELHYIAFDKAGNYSIGIMGNASKLDTYLAYSGNNLTSDISEASAIKGGTTKNVSLLYAGSAGATYYSSDGSSVTSSTVDATSYKDETNKKAAFVSNNAPRLANISVGTDLDGDNNISGDETYTVYETSYTWTSNKTSLDAGSASSAFITAKGKTEIRPEILGGNGALYYTYAISNTSGDTLTSGENATSFLTGSTDTSTAQTGTITMQLGDFINKGITDTGTAAPHLAKFTIWDSTEGTTPRSTSQSADVNVYMAVSLRDGTAPTAEIDPFHWASASDNSLYVNSTANGHIELENDLPSTFTDGTDKLYDRDPKVSGSIVITGTVKDNIRLGAIYLSVPGMEAKFGSSGAKLATTTSGSTTFYKMATYTAGSGWDYTTDSPLDKWDDYGFKFSVDTSTFTTDGHTATWTFSWNTSKIASVAATEVKVQVLAMDEGTPSVSTTGGTLVSMDGTTTYAAATYSSAKPSATSETQTTSSAKGPYYKVDVVPYVTKVYTKLAKDKKTNWSVYNRTALGHYPVQSVVSNIDSSISLNTTTSEDVVLYGFNLNSSTAKITSGGNTFTVGGTNNITSNADEGTLTFNVAKLASGKPTISVNGITAMNNLNNNDAKGNAASTGTAYANWYNRQANGDTNNILTDDIEFDVWEFNDRAAVPINGLATGINMEINQKTGMLNYAFANGGLYYNMGGTVDSTAYSSIYWAGDWDTFAGPCVGFHVDELGNTYSVVSGGDTNNSGHVDKYAFFTSRWGRGTLNTGGTYGGDNALRLEHIALKTGGNTYDYSLMKYRFLSSEFASTVSDTSTNLYLVYYDALTNQIRFRAGTFSSTTKQSTGGFQDSATSQTPEYYKIDNCQVIANGASGASFKTAANKTTTVAGITGRGAGQYVDVAVVKNGTKDVVCVVWFDAEDNCCKFSYIEDPISNWSSLKGNATALNWSSPQTIFAEGGEYCHIVADTNDHLHIAAYAGNGDVMYAYLDTYASTADTCTVDASGAVGEHLTLDVAINSKGNSIPYIGYYTSAIKKPKYAYLVDKTVTDSTATFTQVSDGVDDDERFTGAWEVAVVPTPSRMTTNREDKVNVGVWKTPWVSSTNRGGILKNSTSGTSSIANTLNGYSSTNWSKTYGNGTSNGVLGYQISTATGSCLETAQMR